MNQRKTISDVAARAGVSRSLVSVVLSGRKSTIRVSEETRNRVLEAARAIDYRPNLIAKGLCAKKSFLLAYLCTGGGSWGVSTRLLRSIQNACREKNYSLAVYPSDSLEEELKNLHAALERQVDGIIVSPLMNIDKTNEGAFQRVAASGIPIVQIGGSLSGISGVTRDFLQIGRDAAKLLIAAGKRKIMMITYENYNDPLTGPASFAEYSGYRSVLEKAGLEIDILPVSLKGDRGGSNMNYKAYVTDSAYFQLKEFLQRRENLPDAFLASSNSLGYGAAMFCREKGLRIPEDAVILSCSDDIMMPSMIFPALSCFPLAAEEIGKVAVEQCLNPGKMEKIQIQQKYKEESSFISQKS